MAICMIKRTVLPVWFVLLCSLLQPAAAANVLISEFMATNTRTLADEDGEHSDWIEIHNSGNAPVNLLNWSLTDRAGNLRQWRFPAINLEPEGYLLVFASGKNRRDPAGELHASFRLSASGEYLALVMPDGATIASEFAPAFPPQAPDVSYGLGALTTNQLLISTNAPVTVQVPSSAVDGLNWTGLEYNDSGWLEGTNGIGFGSANITWADYAAAVLPTAPVGYWRLNETSGSIAANLGSGANLNLAYQNVTLGTAGPRPPQFNGFEPDNHAPTFDGSSSFVAGSGGLLSGRSAFTIGGWIKPAATPGNRIGLFGQNDAIEFGFISGATIQCWTPSGGSVNVEYPFPMNSWHHVVAVGDGANIRIYFDGTLAGTGGSAAANYGNSSFPFNIGGGGIFDADGNFFNGQIDEVVVYHRALSAAEVQTLYQGGTTPSSFSVAPYVQTDVGTAMSNVNASAYIRIPFMIEDPGAVSQLSLQMRFSDGFVAFINGEEVARMNAPESLDFHSAATNSRPSVYLEEFKFGAGALEDGANILAIQGMNLSANDPEFLVLAELSALVTLGESAVPVYFTSPTPGAPNSGGASIPGPAFLAPFHRPAVPLPGEEIHVTVKVRPTFHPVSNVTMRYRVMFGPEVELTMHDDGMHGDGEAGDGIYGATIPAGATAGQMVRWYFRATDAEGLTSRWPLFTDPARTSEYLGAMAAATQVTSKLPIVHLFVAPNQMSAVDSQAGGRASVFYDGELYDNVEMQARGNTTAGYSKKSHRFDFNREHPFRHWGPGGRIRKTSFMADYGDPTYMRQGLTFWLCNEIGVPAPFYEPVRLQLNGQFYQLANHNNVLSEELLDYLGYNRRGALYKAAGTVVPSKQSTGRFEKRNRKWDDDSDYADLTASISESLPMAQRRANIFDRLDIPQVINYMVAARWVHENDDVWANMSLYHDNDGDRLWRIVPFDMNLSWGAIFYEGGAPCRPYVEGVQATNDVHKAHPFYGSSQALPCGSGNWNRLYDVIFQTPETREMFLRRMRTVLDNYVLPIGAPVHTSPIEKKIVAWRDLIHEEADADRARWGWPGKGGQTNFDPGINFTEGVQQLLEEFFLPRRNHFYGKHSITNTALSAGITKNHTAGIPLEQPSDLIIDFGQIEFNPSSGDQAQEFIQLVNPNPFAADISGWKIEGGVSFTFKPGTVIPSNGTIYVTPDARAFRSRTTGPRGGQGLFVVGGYEGRLSARGETLRLLNETGGLIQSIAYQGAPSPAQSFLRITEIMYHPARPEAGESFGKDDYEFIKLKNIGTETLDLSGVKFVNGIRFSFTGGAVTSLPPGEQVVVVKNRAAFLERYGASAAMAGEYEGNLDNSGERLRLEDASSEAILDFTYKDTWYPITDGHGFSLVIEDENLPYSAWDRKSSWRPSGRLHGSPDGHDPEPPALAPVVVNELLARSDAPLTDSVELYNPTAVPAVIGGWFLTDDFREARKYRIPNGTIIPPFGYLVFNESHFNTGQGPGSSFAFSARGEEIHLFSGDPISTNLTGYLHGFEFGASDTGVSFGRHITSTGKEHFVAQRELTLGAANAGPEIGPIVISEIMYHPPFMGGSSGEEAKGEYLELHNITDAAAPLYDPAAPANTWRIENAVTFAFPSGAEIPARGFALVVRFDPSNPADLAAFRARHGLVEEVTIFGPWSGRLDNSGEPVELYKPYSPPPGTGAVPYILVDRVNYSNGPPWPLAANGHGPSLQRIDVRAYGDDPINWTAANPTLGGALESGNPPGTTPASITVQPQSANVPEGSNTTLRVQASSASPITYQWLLNGLPVPGGTNDTLTLTNLEPVGDIYHFDYSVLVTNDAGPTLSETATVTLLVNPVFLLEPRAQTVLVGETVIFRVELSGTPPFGYDWRKGTTPLEPMGQGRETYTIENAQLSHAGSYMVAVTNAARPAPGISSSAAFLNVLEPFGLEALRAPDPASIILRFNALSNLSYIVQFQEGLGAGWQTLTNISSAQTNRLIEIEQGELEEGSERFFRLVTPRFP
jgi:hypothetical protein